MGKALLLTRLQDALHLFEEPVWRELQKTIIEGTPAPANPAAQRWFSSDPRRLARERDALTRVLHPAPDSAGIFFQQPRTGCLAAKGMLQTASGENILTELVFPNDFPSSPPRVFFFGPALKKNPRLLREDGSVPVPFGSDRQWTSEMDSGTVLAWAAEWFQQTLNTQQPGSPPQRQEASSSPLRPGIFRGRRRL